jgi:hypothetical protein
MREWLLVPVVTLMTLTPISAQDGATLGRRVVLGVDPLIAAKETSARGTVAAQCGATGTTLRFELAGLVPEGTYSLWMFVFGVTTDAVTPADATAAGALGNGNGASHEFVADGSGRAALVMQQPAGRLSAFGAVRGCLLDEAHWRVIGGYHPRRVTNGTSRPANGEVVEYFGVRSTAAIVTSTN